MYTSKEQSEFLLENFLRILLYAVVLYFWWYYSCATFTNDIAVFAKIMNDDCVVIELQQALDFPM